MSKTLLFRFYLEAWAHLQRINKASEKPVKVGEHMWRVSRK